MTAIVRRWGRGRCDDALERQIARVAGQADVTTVAVMPDVHQGREVPNGIAVATRRLVYPDLIGADIGCGIAAIRFRAAADDVDGFVLEKILRQLLAAVPTLKQSSDRAVAQRAVVESLGPPSCDRLARAAAREGAYQLGTLGRGNHFLELARADDGSLWAVVHTGSRAMGRDITAHHLAVAASHVGGPAAKSEATATPLPCLDLGTPAGRSYFADMQWGCRYAAANRMAILDAVADLLEGALGIDVEPESVVESPHNTATVEEHAGEPVVVHRKSANHAAAGRPGIVAGNMATGSRITVGLGHPDSLASSAHGAGRVMSRSEAAGRLLARDLEPRMRGIVFRTEWVDRLSAEAPHAYRELHDVMKAQRDLVRTAAVLVPILNDKRT